MSLRASRQLLLSVQRWASVACGGNAAPCRAFAALPDGPEHLVKAGTLLLLLPGGIGIVLTAIGPAQEQPVRNNSLCNRFFASHRLAARAAVELDPTVHAVCAGQPWSKALSTADAWSEVVDPSSKQIYYWNKSTGAAALGNNMTMIASLAVTHTQSLGKS